MSFHTKIDGRVKVPAMAVSCAAYKRKQHEASCRSPEVLIPFRFCPPDGAHFEHLGSGAAKAFIFSFFPLLLRGRSSFAPLDYEHL